MDGFGAGLVFSRVQGRQAPICSRPSLLSYTVIFPSTRLQYAMVLYPVSMLSTVYTTHPARDGDLQIRVWLKPKPTHRKPETLKVEPS